MKISVSNQALLDASEKLNQVLKRFKATKNPVLFLVSGGSSLALLDLIRIENLSDNLTLAVLDERYSQDPGINNLAQVMATDFYRKLTKISQLIDTRVTNHETQLELASRFNQELKDWLTSNPQGIVLATMGIGPDGHISGMMPFPEAPATFEKLFLSDGDENLAVAYDAGNKNQYPLRVTTTMNFLKKITTTIVFAAGDSKLQALENVCQETGTLAATPARILRELPEVYLFTDQRI